jgi:hypothetical protein
LKQLDNAVIREFWDIIDNDRYAWVVTWGEARTGKSTLNLLLAYHIYKDWDAVLDSVVFNLNQLLYKIQKGIPRRFPTRNGLHNRIPLIVWDDFACHSGKARTQHERSWDIFKGAFDSLGTKLGVLIANMVIPSSPTAQLTEKFTHECWVYTRGRVKFDRIRHQQDYYNYRARQKKDWIDDFEFGQVPKDVFKQYDEMRCGLADEVLVSISDTMVATELDKILKRLLPVDVELMNLIFTKGLLHTKTVYSELGNAGKEAVVRLKARGLVVPRRMGKDYYKYDLSDFGLNVLKVANEKEGET